VTGPGDGAAPRLAAEGTVTPTNDTPRVTSHGNGIAAHESWWNDYRLPADDLAEFVPPDKIGADVNDGWDVDGDREAETRRWVARIRRDAADVAMCSTMAAAVDRWSDGSREAAKNGTLAVVRFDERGHRGLPAALDALWSVRPDRGRERDFRRVTEWARELVAKRPSSEEDIYPGGCLCDMWDAGTAVFDPAEIPGTIRSGVEKGMAEPYVLAGTEDAAPAALRSLRLRKASEFTMRATDWAWGGRIALRALALIAGREGEGKSTLAYWLLSAITRGELAGDLSGEPRNVVVAATEDSWEATIVPRLVAAGADLDRIFRIEVEEVDGSEGVLLLPRDVQEARRVLLEVEAAVLLFDPLMSRVDGKLDTHKDQEVRQALEPLTALADEVRCAVVGLIHLSKASTTDPLTAIMASRAFVAVARSVLLVTRDPDDDSRERRLVGLAKNNLGREDLPTLGFTIAEKVVGRDPDSRKVIKAGGVAWGEDSARTIREVFADGDPGGDVRSTLEDAVSWLSGYLTDDGGTVQRQHAIRDGQRRMGFAERTLQRAAARLKLVTHRQGFQGAATWSFPEAK
jgi:hypothetical protein